MILTLLRKGYYIAALTRAVSAWIG
ncbi:hypothetical protein Q648_00865, partial [Bartonella quintana JK 12]